MVKITSIKEVQSLLKSITSSLKSMDGATIEIARAVDDDGFSDLQCPECNIQFKVTNTALKQHAGEVTCPFCFSESSEDRWRIDEQFERAKADAAEYSKARFSAVVARWPAPTVSDYASILRVEVGADEKLRIFAKASSSLPQMRERSACVSCGTVVAANQTPRACPLCGLKLEPVDPL